MMFRTAFVLPLATASMFALPALAQEEKASIWIQDFAKAKAQAKAEKKDLLIDFTGSDWCSWCIKLDKEVFADAAFVDAAPKSFVLVKLDYPQDQSLVTDEIRAQNEKLQQEYPVRGFPTILLTDAEGRVYGQTGYAAGGAAPYLANLTEMKKQGGVFQAAMLRAEGKKGLERAQAFDEGLAALPEEVVDAFHLATMQEIVTLDADDAGKLKTKYDAKVQKLLESKLINTEANALQKLINPHMQANEGEQAIAKLDAIIKAPSSKVQHQLALFFKGMVTMDTSGDAKAAIESLELAKSILPDSPVSQRIDQMLPDLKKTLDGGK